MNIDDDDEAKVTKAISGLFMPKNIADAMEHLVGLHMADSSSFNEEALLKYFEAVTIYLQRLPESIGLDSKRVRDAVLRGMRPKSFAHYVDHHSPADMQNLCKLSLDTIPSLGIGDEDQVAWGFWDPGAFAAGERRAAASGTAWRVSSAHTRSSTSLLRPWQAGQ